MSAQRIRVVIAEDQRMVLGALAALLSLEPDIEVVAQACDGSEARARLGLSAGTVRNYLSEVILKLGAANRIEAARIAREKGWL